MMNRTMNVGFRSETFCLGAMIYRRFRTSSDLEPLAVATRFFIRASCFSKLRSFRHFHSGVNESIMFLPLYCYWHRNVREREADGLARVN